MTELELYYFQDGGNKILLKMCSYTSYLPVIFSHTQSKNFPTCSGQPMVSSAPCADVVRGEGRQHRKRKRQEGENKHAAMWAQLPHAVRVSPSKRLDGCI